MLGVLAAIAITVVHGHCVQCDHPYRLGEMQFLSRTNGWAAAFYSVVSNEHVSFYGALLHTADGGNHWTQVPDIGTYGVDVVPAFSFIDAKRGWASWSVASDPMDHLIRTRDGGRTWRNLGAPGYLVHLQFFTAQQGVAVESTAEKPLFRSTTNGGAAWEQQPLELDFPSLFQFLNPNVGWIAGDARGSDVFHPRVLYTSDGGRSWLASSMPAGVVGTPRDMFFIDERKGWLILWNGSRQQFNTLLQSVDGGKSWQVDPHSEFHRPDRLLDAVRFLSPRTGFVFVTDGDILSENESEKSGAVFWTSDGGETWQQQPLPSPVQSCTTVGSEIWCGSGMDLMKVSADRPSRPTSATAAPD